MNEKNYELSVLAWTVQWKVVGNQLVLKAT